MAKKKGSAKTGGRVKGTPNHITKSIKQAIESAFHDVGGQAYLTEIARDDPKTFCTLLAKIIPTEVRGQLSAQLAITTEPKSDLELARRMIFSLSLAEEDLRRMGMPELAKLMQLEDLFIKLGFIPAEPFTGSPKALPGPPVVLPRDRASKS